MAGFRQIDPNMWSDPWTLELTSDEKLLWIYMFSNGRTSLSGLYEISEKQIKMETELDHDLISNTITKFVEDKKIVKEDNIYFVVNLLKRHFSKSPKVIIRVKDDIKNIKECEPKRACIKKYSELIGYEYSTDTLPIPYNKQDNTLSASEIYPIDTVSLKDEDKDEDKDENKMNSLESAFKTMHKTIFPDTFNKSWWDIMEAAPKKLESKVLIVIVNNSEMAEEVNTRVRSAQKSVAAAGFPFASFILKEKK